MRPASTRSAPARSCSITGTRGSRSCSKRNPNYWQEGKPYLDEVIFSTVGDDNARVAPARLGRGPADHRCPGLARRPGGRAGRQRRHRERQRGRLHHHQREGQAAGRRGRALRPCLCDRPRRDRQDRLFRPRHARPSRCCPSSTFYYDANTDPDRLRSRQGEGAAGQELGAARLRASRRKCRAATRANWRRRRSGLPSLAQIGVTMKIEQLEATTAQDRYNTREIHAAHLGLDQRHARSGRADGRGAGLRAAERSAQQLSQRRGRATWCSRHARRLTMPRSGRSSTRELQRIVNRDCPFLYTVEQDRIYRQHARGRRLRSRTRRASTASRTSSCPSSGRTKRPAAAHDPRRLHVRKEADRWRSRTRRPG